MKRKVLGAAVLALVASPAAAQESLTRGPAQRQPISWRLALGAEESYESNVLYASSQGQDDFVTRAAARMDVTFPIRRGTVELDGEGGASVYRTVEGLNRFTWGAGFGLEHSFTRRSRIDAHARVAQAFARDDARLSATGALPPMTLTRSESAEVLWRESLTRRLETKVGGRAERFRFDAPGLQDGWTAGARVGMEYALRRRVGVGVAGEYARTATSPSAPPDGATPLVDALGRTFDIASVVATLRLDLERRLSLRLEGGAARFQSVLDGSATAASDTAPLAVYPPTTTPTGAAALTGTAGRHTLIASASRRVEQTYGLGSIGVNRTLGLVYRLALARRAAFTLAGTVNQSSEPVAAPGSDGHTVAAGFDVPLPAAVSLHTTYSYWEQRDAVHGRNWRDHTVSVAVSRRFGGR